VTRWVLASSNAGKLREFAHALAPILTPRQIDLVAQSSLGVVSADEPFDTFRENALAKAIHASRETGLPALADDSGVSVACLGGRPGVRSARYWDDFCSQAPRDLVERLSELPTDEANLQWLLHEVRMAKAGAYLDQEPPESFWNAAYVATIAFVRGPNDASPIVVSGDWPGRIVLEARGSGGFGYDPIFFDRHFGRTAAELTLGEKQSVSHRGQALLKLLQELSIADV
jgi:XTP/dITP diphosphohydrolase